MIERPDVSRHPLWRRDRHRHGARSGGSVECSAERAAIALGVVEHAGIGAEPHRQPVADGDGQQYDVVAEATNGEMAVEMALRLKPDIVCLDVDMPKMGGLEALAKIRAALPQTIVLMVTAHTERETVQTAIAGGAAGYIVKPFNSGRVLATIAAALAKNAAK